MKIVHISDLHYPDHIGTEQLINKIINYYAEEINKPIVVCSGDILETPPARSNENHYVQASTILKKLKTNGFKLLLCPGNHDLKKGGVSRRKRIHPNLMRFSHHYSSLLPENANYPSNAQNNLHQYPLVHQFENHFFIGLNSITYQPKSAKGMLGEVQLEDLETTLSNIRSNEENPIITVYLHHNPLPFHLDVNNVPGFGDRIVSNKLRLIDRKAFLKKIKGIDVLLFGHIHSNVRETEFEQKYDINCIQRTGASTSTNKEKWTEIDTSDFSSVELPN